MNAASVTKEMSTAANSITQELPKQISPVSRQQTKLTCHRSLCWTALKASRTTESRCIFNESQGSLWMRSDGTSTKPVLLRVLPEAPGVTLQTSRTSHTSLRSRTSHTHDTNCTDPTNLTNSASRTEAAWTCWSSSTTQTSSWRVQPTTCPLRFRTRTPARSSAKKLCSQPKQPKQPGKILECWTLCLSWCQSLTFMSDYMSCISEF